VATAGWELFGVNGLLRSVAVGSTVRGRGAGTLIVAAALRRMVVSGVKTIYLMTETAEPFFTSCGFAPIERDEIPADMADHPQVTRECSAAAQAMMLRLPVR
jgi:amino-acid N-acetyltransferase